MKRKTLSIISLIIASLLFSVTASSSPDPGDENLYRATESLRQRIVEGLPTNQAARLQAGHVEAFLSDEERDLFSSQYLRFAVNQAVQVRVYVDRRLNESKDPFWLREQGFRHRPEAHADAFSHTFEAWEKDFPAGEIGLGIHALRPIREHYFVVISPLEDKLNVSIDPIFPDGMEVHPWAVGSPPWSDRSSLIDSIAPQAEDSHAQLLAPLSSRRNLAEVYGYFRATPFPASARPDQISLTLSKDPTQSLFLQWRQSGPLEVDQKPFVEFWEQIDLPQRFAAAGAKPVKVTVSEISLPAGRVLNAQNTLRLRAELAPLRPDTRYQYRILAPNGESLAGPFSFRSAPLPNSDEFYFLYFGDVQEDYETFTPLLDRALENYPHPAFIVFAGDLVSRGNDQDDWDAFFAAVDERLAGIPIAPTIGNHELLPADRPDLYLSLFQLPRNGPDGLAPGRAWLSRWGQLGLVALDSNEDGGQAEWVERVLTDSDWTASIVVAHHGAYTSRPGRYNWRIREHWAPIFEQAGVSLVLQGHDHAYLRTYPFFGGEIVEANTSGTTYVIATAGGKFYPQASHNYADKAIPETRTFQVITVPVIGDCLKYRAYDETGTLLDHFEK